MTKQSARMLIELVGDELSTQQLPGSYRVLAALHKLTAGCFQSTSGDIFGAHQSTQSKNLHAFLWVMLRYRHRFLRFPSDLSIVKEAFSRLGMPGVIGAVDGSHIRIKRPPYDPNSDRYFHRKSQISINVQLVAAPDLRFYNAVARWPGSTHDSRVFLTVPYICVWRQGTFEEKGSCLETRGILPFHFCWPHSRRTSYKSIYKWIIPQITFANFTKFVCFACNPPFDCTCPGIIPNIT